MVATFFIGHGPDMADENRLIALEEQITHQGVVIEDLSDLLRSQGQEIDRLKARIEMLMRRAADSESAVDGSIPLADQTPPHW